MATTAPTKRIFLSPPHMSGREQGRIEQAFESNYITSAGPQLEEFERQFAKYVGVPYALAVSSGTAALHLAVRDLKLRPGEEVLCSTFTFCASANPIVYEQGKPVFIDSDSSTWNLDPNLVADELAACAKMGKLPRAIVAVDLFGQSADVDAIQEISAKYSIPVIEDAAESLGATYKARPTGSGVWASFFSFNGNKIITTSGGGMLCSNDKDLIDRARFLSTQARDPAPHYQHSMIGYNYRMSNVLAAIGLEQLAVLDERVLARRQNFEFYRQQLEGVPGIAFMPEAPYGRSNRWLTAILIDKKVFGASCEDVRVALETQNIESRPVWKPLHLQPAFSNCRFRGGSVAERLFANGLCLPSGSALTKSDLMRVVECVRAVSDRGTEPVAVRRAA